MQNVSIDYFRVSEQTKKIKNDSSTNLKDYAKTEYSAIKKALNTSKGAYKEALLLELDAEEKAVEQVAELIIKLQNMIESIANSYQETDNLFAKGSTFINK